MKTLFLFLVLLTVNAFAGAPVSAEQFMRQQEYDRTAKAEGWTFKYDVRNLEKVGKSWGLGYIKKSQKGPVYAVSGEDENLKSWDLEMFPHKHTPTMDQGGCGSCVIFSFTYNFEESLRLRGLDIPSLSQQHLMACGSGGQCSGAYGEEIAEDLVRLKNLYALSDYPYTASNGTCKTKTTPRYGQIASYKTIDGSVKSILAAIHNGQPVSVGIAAGGSFGSYSGGIYNACNSTGVNHYVVIVGVDCETAVDANGYCKFDAKGNLPPGVGTFRVQNSWGNSYGVDGVITMKITKSNGQRCHQIAADQGDAQILDIGLPMPEDKPVTFNLGNGSVDLRVTVQPGSGYGVDAAKKAISNALSAVGE